MADEKIKDISLEALVSIRDEIKGLREDTNKRFEQMDKRFEKMDKRFEKMEEDIAQIRQDIGHIVARFDKDFLLMASDLEDVKKRLQVCEQNIGLQN